MTDAIKKLLDDAVSSGNHLGIGYIAVDRTGQTIYSAAHGKRTFSSEEPLSLDTAGFLASMTKLVTSVAAMQVVERGLVGLDDDLGSILPQLKNRDILVGFDGAAKQGVFKESTNKITLRLLLTHTAGFSYDDTVPALTSWVWANGRQADFFTGEFKAWERPLVFNPGTKWIYGSGVDWAGKVVETLTKQTLEEYMQENIFSKVGMLNTTFHPGRRTHYPMMDMTFRNTSGPFTAEHFKLHHDPPSDNGGVGLFSTAADYAKFLTSLLLEDEKLLSKTSWDTFTQSNLTDVTRAALAARRAEQSIQVDIPFDVPVDHALGGLLVTEDVPGRRRKGSMCWDGMSNPNWMIDREAGVAIVLFTQVLPQVDPYVKKLYAELETEVYRIVDARRQE